MDELLSLFDDDNTAGGVPVASAGTGTAETTVPKQSQNEDDFASAFLCTSTSKSKVNTQSNNSKGRPLSAVSKAAVITGNNASKHDQTSCDPITGLRVTDRKTSRAEMCDHFSTLTYKSVSMLAAASRSEWNTYTTDGSDKGSTTLATCGIITSDTTSRVSSKTGRAFGMIQLGDIIGGSLPLKSNNIHALVTVFLFGEALSVIQRNKRFLQKGWVCAILSPSLMPSKNDNKGSSSTAVSLSVNDPKQILLIGRSVDAGNCKGTIRKKVPSDYGGSKFEDVGCSTLIDLRGGSRYCITHRRQGLSSRGGTSTNNSKTSSDNSRLQKLRSDNVRNGITHASSFNNTNHQRNNNLLSQNSMQVGRTSSISLSEALSRPGFLDETLPVAASSSMTTTQHLEKAPKHMKKATNAKETRVLHNPYTKSKATDQCAKRKGHEDVLGEALGRKKARLDNSFSKNASSMKANVKATKSKVFQAEGYDGSVQVPKPSSLFRKAATFRPGSLSSSANNKTATSDILEKQRSLAELLQQKKQGVVNSRTEDLLSRLSSNMTRVQPSSSSVKSGQSSRNTFASSFGDFGNDNDILNAKSRFASAANAQEYARARGAIQELEVKEFEMDKRKQRTSGGATKNGGKDKEASTKGIVTAGWICKTCKKKTPMKPVVCIRAKHDVQQQRELSNRKSTIGSTKERLQRHGKEAEEGGLTLGSGLEWSWRGGIN
ncbi:hypothetical protein ACHAWC_003500 [Mediolabrus comicus]